MWEMFGVKCVKLATFLNLQRLVWLPLGLVWLGEWNSWGIKNGGGKEKVRGRRDFNFPS